MDNPRCLTYCVFSHPFRVALLWRGGDLPPGSGPVAAASAWPTNTP